jgi:hypothetical protein
MCVSDMLRSAQHDPVQEAFADTFVDELESIVRQHREKRDAMIMSYLTMATRTPPLTAPTGEFVAMPPHLGPIGPEPRIPQFKDGWTKWYAPGLSHPEQ